jgi:hypothetical protein
MCQPKGSSQESGRSGIEYLWMRLHPSREASHYTDRLARRLRTSLQFETNPNRERQAMAIFASADSGWIRV